ncbi:hypothetical protein TWF694_007271 [Orbilia ellipsospora]|uniref:PLC-like phosphodiesterase n=1 Tax=Orbilia ellipsospora TaxID=2528407 RepID=A0AAV9XIU9_9PEZI
MIFPIFPSLLFAALLATSSAQSSPSSPPSSTWTEVTPTVASATTDLAASASPELSCNGSPLLCDRKYNNITYMGAHDSAFLHDASTGESLAGNQNFNATIALDSGIRFLQAQVHNQEGTLELCHTSCFLLDAGTLTAWLTKIRYWLDQNPNEVITILLVNSDNVDTSQFGAAFTASGLSNYGYTPQSPTGSSTNWPTLRTMITTNKRLVAFVTGITYTTTYPYLLNEFTHIFETPFTVLSLTGFNCTLDRPSGFPSFTAALSAGMMPLMNHFADTEIALNIAIPNLLDIKTTNSPSTTKTGALGLHAANCLAQWGQKPIFILVDFYDQGPAIDTANKLNGVTPTQNKPVPSTTTTANNTATTTHSGASLTRVSYATFASIISSVLVVIFLSI